MSWINLRFTTSAATAEALGDALSELGALSVSINDAAAGTPQEQPIFGEPGIPEEALWNTCAVSALFPLETDIDAITSAASKMDGLSVTAPCQIEIVPELDWVRLTQAQFDPICISARLWIVPTWHKPPAPQAINIQLDPGLAFGTGSHPTTKLCLQWLEEHIQGGEMVLDYGCGSGILAIAAKKLGAARVCGIDIDPQAIDSARQNSNANDVLCEFFLPDEAPKFASDITVANILAIPLKVLAPLLAKYVQVDGRIILSGILTPQAAEIMGIYARWFNMRVYKEDSGWVCLEGIRYLSGNMTGS